MEYWNIYQSVAYSAEGPLCMLLWSFTTRSQIKYLSHLNKKASAGSLQVVECVCVCVCVCLRVWREMLVVCYPKWLVWIPGWQGCVEPVRMEIWDSPSYLLIHRDWNQPQLIHCTVATEGICTRQKEHYAQPNAAVYTFHRINIETKSQYMHTAFMTFHFEWLT